MGIRFSSKNVITEIVKLGFSAYLISTGVSEAAAAAAASIVGGFISGTEIRQKSNVRKMQDILEQAIGEIYYSEEYELPSACYDELIREFSIRRTRRFLADIKPQETVSEIIKTALERSPDCDISTLPLDEIAENMLEAIYSSLYENAELIDPIILEIVKGIKVTADRIEKTVVRIENKISPQQPVAADDIKLLTASPPFAADNTILHRERELTDIQDLMDENKCILLLSGFGGIGKTTVAKRLFQDNKNKYDESAWIPYKGDLKQSVLAAIQLYNDINDPEARLQAIIRKLKNDGKSKLIVIDNADHDEAEGIDPASDNELSAITGWNDTTVIVTSRLSELRGYVPYEVGFLSEGACTDIFYSYYKYDKEGKHKDAVLSLVRLACCHTYTVELFAKGANREGSLEEYYEKLKNDLGDTDYRFRVSHHPDKATIAGHLKKLFDLQKRNEAEQRAIRVFSVLPVNTILSKDKAKKWFGLNAAALDTLADDGWLSFADGYYLHPVLKNVALLDEFPKDIFSHFLSCLEDQDDKYFSNDEPYLSIIRKREIAEAVVDSVDDSEKGSLEFGEIFANLAFSYYVLGDYDRALEFFEKALDIRESKLGTDHPDTATTYNNIAVVYEAKGDYDRALEYHEKDLKVKEKKLGKDHPDTATTYNNIAIAYEDKGDYDRALEYHEKDLKICESKLGTDHPDTAATYNNIAVVYKDKGEYDRALAYYEKALKIREKKLGKDHPDTATTYNNIAGVYEDKGDYDRALAYYEKALKIVKSKLGTDHPDTAATYDNIAGVYYYKGDCDRALAYYEKALKIKEKKLGTDHPDTATTYNNIAVVYKDKGDCDRALAYYEKALKIREKKLGTDHPRTATTYNNIAGVYYYKGDCDRALAYFKKALEIRESTLGTDHPDTAVTYNNIAVVYEAKGDFRQALEFYVKANRNRR